MHFMTHIITNFVAVDRSSLQVSAVSLTLLSRVRTWSKLIGNTSSQPGSGAVLEFHSLDESGGWLGRYATTVRIHPVVIIKSTVMVIKSGVNPKRRSVLPTKRKWQISTRSSISHKKKYSAQIKIHFTSPKICALAFLMATFILKMDFPFINPGLLYGGSRYSTLYHAWLRLQESWSKPTYCHLMGY